MNCNIVRDLLPLYHDGVCSEESRTAVEEHLTNCAACRQILADMDAPLPAAEEKRTEEDAAVVERIAQEWRRLWRRTLLTGTAAVLILCLGGFAFWCSVTQCVVPMDSGNYAYLSTCVLESGEICLEAGLNKACRNLISYEADEPGVWHLCILRPLLRLNIFLGTSDKMFPFDLVVVRWKFDPRDFSSGEVGSVYFGEGEDAILLWSEEGGYAVPAATETEEAYWNDWSPGHVLG